jgi:hypothetical protein
MSDLNAEIITFAKFLYNSRDAKNKNKWKHIKIIRKNNTTFVYVYGNPLNNFKCENFKQVCEIDLTDNNENKCKNINAGSPRIIINFTNNTYKIAFVKGIFSEDNYEMKEKDCIKYFESDEYQIDTNDVNYLKLKIKIES